MSKKQCYHCNEVCINEITHDNKSFCCLGCKTVYQILHDNQMDFYYSIENNPGIRAHNAPENLIYLDDPVHIQPFILYEDDRIVRASFTIPSIHCAACVWLLENMFKLNNNLLNLEVNLGERSFSFSYIKDQISFREIVELLIKIGYSPSLNDHHKGDSQKKIQTAYIAKLAVAGFCFGNIMLFSFPAYFGIDKNSFMGQSFDWLNIIFSIPILLYCSIPFYTDALVSIRTKQMSLNIPIFLGIIALAIQTFWEIFTQTGHGYADSLAGLIFFLLLGRWIQNRSIDYLNFERDYKSFFPIWVEKYEPDYLTTHVSIQELEKGDHYKVKAQCIIPVDSILKSKKALIDYSFVSGEAHPVAIKEGQKIFAGGRQLGSSIELLVDRNLSSSYLSRIWDQMNKTVTTQQTILNFMSKYFPMDPVPKTQGISN